MSNLMPSLIGFHSSYATTLIKKEISAVRPGQRLVLLDAVKGMAACIIVGHHLSLYSPRSELADEFAPTLMLGLYYYGPYVVQTFLVFGGFALALTMPDQPISWRRACSAFGMRYLRLAAPYLVTLMLLMAVHWSALGRAMNPPLIDAFSWLQLLAHLFFLQDVLGFGNLSAGTWYLCIDLQFVALVLFIQSALSSLGKRLKRNVCGPVAMSACLIPLGVAASWTWNRIPEGETYVFYFLGSLVLGSLVGWAAKGRIPWLVCILYAIAIASSLAVEFRPRMVVALSSAMIIYVALRLSAARWLPQPLLWLGKISYSLFLIHYLVGGIVVQCLDPWIGDSPARSFVAMVIAFAASVAAAAALFYGVEAPCHRWLKSRGKSAISLPALPTAPQCQPAPVLQHVTAAAPYATVGRVH